MPAWSLHPWPSRSALYPARRGADPHADADLHTDADPHTDADLHANADSHTDANPHSDANDHTDANPHTVGNDGADADDLTNTWLRRRLRLQR